MTFMHRASRRVIVLNRLLKQKNVASILYVNIELAVQFVQFLATLKLKNVKLKDVWKDAFVKFHIF